jgi:flagellar hook protein FlgE
MDPISTARYGMMAATQQLTASANRIASAGPSGDVDYGAEAVTQIESKQAFKADVGVIKVADEMWQSLLDLQTSSPQAR